MIRKSFFSLILILCVSCSSSSSFNQQQMKSVQPEPPTEVAPSEESQPKPEMAQPVEEPTEEPVEAPMEEPAPESVSLDQQQENILDYFPFEANLYKRFEGSGNEFASFDMTTQYMNDDRIQFVTNNGGTQLVTVYERADNEIKIVFRQGEVYYRENMLDRTGYIGTYLRGPVEVGTSWVNIDNQEVTITNVNLTIEGYQCIEVSTSDTVSYFGKGIGLVKLITKVENEEIVSTLVEVKRNQPQQGTIPIFKFINNAWRKEEVKVDLYTNDTFRIALTDQLIKKAILPKEALIQSLYKNTTDDRVYVDVNSMIYDGLYSQEDEMNRLQSLVRSIGSLYSTNEIYLWVDNGAYSGPFVSMAKNELLQIKP